jgi:hypothetical protein
VQQSSFNEKQSINERPINLPRRVRVLSPLDTCSSTVSSAMGKLGKIIIGLESHIVPGESSV